MRRLGFVRQAMVCTCTLFFALAGSAEETEPDYGATGPYVGIGAAYAWDQFDSFGSLDPDMAIGFDAWGGYRFVSYLAAELQLEYLNGFDVQIPGFGFFSGGKLEGEAVTFTGNLNSSATVRGRQNAISHTNAFD
jgi:hypothetical protein